jgi:TonB family protein
MRMDVMRSHARGASCIVAVVFGFGLARTALAEDAAALADRLHRVDAATALDGSGVAPWHLKMSVQMFDAKGQPGEQGLIEEWWSGAQMDRVVYALPSYKATELQRGGEFFRSKGAEQPPLMLELLREQVVHPMPQARDVEGTKAEVRKEKFGKVAVECIMLDRPVKAQVYFPIGVFPTYCMDVGKESLRVSYDYGSQLILRNEVDDFQGRAVARDISIDRGGVAVAKGRVFKLEAATGDESVFAQGDLERVRRPLRVAAATMAGTLISNMNPSYPAAAKTRNAAGTVIVQAVIGRDGHVGFVRLVASPDLDLGEAAMDAVKQRIYKPYVVDGEAVNVETTMIVNFSVAP